MSRWEDKVHIQNMRAFCFKLLWGRKKKNILKWEERIMSITYSLGVWFDVFIFDYIWCVQNELPGDAVVKKPPANAGDSGDLGSIPGLGRSPGEGNGNPLQYYCLGNPMDRGAWWVTVQWMAEELDLTEWLSKHAQCIQNTLVSYVPINTTWWV